MTSNDLPALDAVEDEAAVCCMCLNASSRNIYLIFGSCPHIYVCKSTFLGLQCKNNPLTQQRC